MGWGGVRGSVGACVEEGGSCMAGLCVWRGAHAWRGACVAGDMRGRARTPPPQGDTMRYGQ